MRDVWESLIRDFVRRLKGTNRAVNTQTIYRRAALGLVGFLAQDGDLPAPRQLTRRHIKAYMAHRSAPGLRRRPTSSTGPRSSC